MYKSDKIGYKMDLLGKMNPVARINKVSRIPKQFSLGSNFTGEIYTI